MCVTAEKIIDFNPFLEVIETEKKPKRPSVNQQHSKEVYPIRESENIQKCIDVLNQKIERWRGNSTKYKLAKRNKMLFVVGINVGIRASDLVKLQFSFFMDGFGHMKERYVIKQEKTKNKNKYVTLFFNPVVQKVVADYKKEFGCRIDDYLFPSQKCNDYGDVVPLKAKELWRIMDNLAKDAELPYNIGSHSLRKTFGYWAYQNAKDKTARVQLLQKIFNHSSPLVTLTYIGITYEEIEEVFNSLDFGVELT